MQPETLTCSDLGKACPDLHDACHLQHDPRRQGFEDDHCRCWTEPTTEDFDRQGFVRSELEDQPCRRVLVIRTCTPEHGVKVVLCCSCQDGILDELGEIPPENDWLWMDWATEALRWRDCRRMDSAPVAADMDVEAGYLELETV